jgi:uncharacterized protein (TIGR03437 family)
MKLAALLFCLLVRAVAQDASFAAAQFFLTDSQPFSASIDDFDGDGNLDLAVFMVKSGMAPVASIRVYFGKGDGSFRPGGAIVVSASVGGSILSADFDGDGKKDLVLFDGSTGFYMFYGRGDGTFQDPFYFPSRVPNPRTITVGDFDGDGKPDIAVLSGSGTSYLTVWLSKGINKFNISPSVVIGTTSSSVSPAMAAADLNGDGRDDLVVVGASAYLLDSLLSTGSGNFGDPIHFALPPPLDTDVGNSVRITDLNGDKNRDVLIGGSLSGQLIAAVGVGDGSFRIASYPSLAPAQGNYFQVNSLISADFNLDGSMDAAVDIGFVPSGQKAVQNSPLIVLGGGTGSFRASKLYPIDSGSYKAQLLTADLNHDGKPDLVGLGGDGDGFFAMLNITPARIPNSIVLSSTSLHFDWKVGTPAPVSQTITLTDGLSTGVLLGWSATSNAPWLAVSPSSGPAIGPSTPSAKLSISINTDALPAGAATGQITVSASGITPQIVNISVTIVPVTPTIIISSIGNGAGPLQSNIAPGEIITIKGSGLGPATGTSFSLDPVSGLVPSQLGGSQVFIANVAAPLIYASEKQINAVVPYEVMNQTTVEVNVQFQGSKTQDMLMAVSSTAPAAFTVDSTGGGQAAASNQDGSLNGPTNPAAKGSYVTVYFTGGGQTDPTGVTGSVTGAILKQYLGQVKVTVGGIPAAVAFAGAAPTFLDGLGQLNLILAASTPSGPAQPIVITVGAGVSPMTATLAVQ